jgi:hypothetical protein
MPIFSSYNSLGADISTGEIQDGAVTAPKLSGALLALIYLGL